MALGFLTLCSVVQLREDSWGMMRNSACLEEHQDLKQLLRGGHLPVWLPVVILGRKTFLTGVNSVYPLITNNLFKP